LFLILGREVRGECPKSKNSLLDAFVYQLSHAICIMLGSRFFHSVCKISPLYTDKTGNRQLVLKQKQLAEQSGDSAVVIKKRMNQ
jgi:hypothetical protein